MSVSPEVILLIVAIVCFVIEALKVHITAPPRTNFFALGWAFVVAAIVVTLA